jgi:hypothetical protein
LKPISGSGFKGSGLSPAASHQAGRVDRKRDAGFAELLKSEYRMPNVEAKNSINFYRLKRQSAAIPSFEILRFVILPFCGSLFDLAESHTK